ncbi:MAG TPA: nitroreductase family deazaflavin-dependent oxidoreductase, partial [Polyangiaceae bacterium]
HEPRSGTYVIASGWGEKSDWLQNVPTTPRVTVYVGARRFEADAVRLAVDDATRALSAYAGRHPKAFSRLGNVMLGRRLRPTPEDCRSLAESVPLVALKPSDV